MQQTAVRQASELDEATREWLKKLFGRELAADDRIVVSVANGNSEPTAAQKEQARTQLEQRFAQVDSKLPESSDDEFNAALHEAIQHVRSNP